MEGENNCLLYATDLQLLIDRGIIDWSDVRQKAEQVRREEALKQHDNKIWQSKTNGYWYTYLTDKNGIRKLVKKKYYDDLVDRITEVANGEDDNSATFREKYFEWNNSRAKRGRIKQATKDRYDCEHERYFQPIDKIHLSGVKPYVFQQFLEDTVSKYDLTAKSYNSIKTILRGTLKLAKRQEIIKFSVDEMIEGADVSDRQFRKVIHEDNEEVFDEDETAKVIEYLKNHRNVVNDCIFLLFCTGMRVGEAVVLKPCNISEEIVQVRATETRYYVGYKRLTYDIENFPKTAAGVRDIVLPSECAWLMRSLIEQCKNQEFVFMSRGKRVTSFMVRKRLYKICDKLGIVRKSPHKIRKTYATILLDNNVDKNFILSQMGHETIVTTERHYHRNRKSIEEKSKIISGISDFKCY